MRKLVSKWFKRTQTFPYVQLHKRRNTRLIIVKNQENKCVTEAEKILYQQLRNYFYYPTPHYKVGNVSINLALVPYKVALIEKREGMNKKKIERALQKRKWQVLFYNATQVQNDVHTYIRTIQTYAPQQIQNVYSS